MRNAWITAAVGGAASALAYLLASYFPGAVIVGFFAQVPLYYAGLALGLPAAAIAAGVSVALVLIGGGALVALAFALVNALPALVLTRHALLSRTDPDGATEWYPPGLLIALLTVLGMAGFSLAYLGFLGMEGGLRGAIQHLFDPVVQAMGPRKMWFAASLALVLPIVPGMTIATLMLLNAINGALAQGLLEGFGRNRRPAPDLAHAVLPQWIAIALCGSLLAARLGSGELSYVGANLAIILSVPFFFIGLAVIHALFRKFANRRLMLIGFYAAIILLAWPIAILAGLGFIENWLGFRRHILAHGPDREV